MIPRSEQSTKDREQKETTSLLAGSSTPTKQPKDAPTLLLLWLRPLLLLVSRLGSSMHVGHTGTGDHGALPPIDRSGRICPSIHKTPIRHRPPRVVGARVHRDVGVRVRAVVARQPDGVGGRGSRNTDNCLSARRTALRWGDREGERRRVCPCFRVAPHRRGASHPVLCGCADSRCLL